MGNLLTGVENLPGIGPKKKEQLASLGLYTIGDILTHAPLRYEDRSRRKEIAALRDGEKACVSARAVGKMNVIRKNGKTLYTQSFMDGTGTLYVAWQNSPYLTRSVHPGGTYTFYGRVSQKGNRKQMFSPIFAPRGQEGASLGRIVPIYPASAAVSQALLLKAAEGALTFLDGTVRDILPPDVLHTSDVYPIEKALRALHAPLSMEEAEKAMERMKFQELFLLLCGMQMQRKGLAEKEGFILSADLRPFLAALPFTPTDGQKNAICDILGDMKSGRPMNRLLEGDVGSGKTVVAAAALYVAAKNDMQGIMLAPTEILARQHAAVLCSFLPDTEICLLTGRLSAKARREAEESIRSGRAKIIVGSHAVLNEKLPLSRVRVCVVDEQHRFGVRQRGFLSALSPAPHVLVMSATPIPRTLSLTFYGDLDISILPSVPNGRQPVDTYAVPFSYRERIYAFIEKALQSGNRAYIICPLAEEGGEDGLCDAVSYAENLKTRFGADTVLCLHGKMKNKDEIMEKFSTGSPKVLVSTTVVEVGVDVPSATVMVVENAERFGLSQLHQLRGRVGRGKDKSYCILLSEPKTEEARARLKTMQNERDGFKIAEEDLRLRGPGEFFGTRQHGDMQLIYADILEDHALLARASAAAGQLTASDPALSRHPEIREAVGKLYHRYAMN